MKKKLAIQKQATLMDRFLKRDAPNTQTIPTVLNETTYNFFAGKCTNFHWCYVVNG